MTSLAQPVFEGKLPERGVERIWMLSESGLYPPLVIILPSIG